MKKQLDESFKLHIIKLRTRGYTVKEIAEIYEISIKTVNNIIRRYTENGNTTRKIGSGRTKIYNIDNAIKEIITKDNSISISQIVALLNTKHNIDCSRTTVYRNIKNMDYYNKRPIIKPLLSEKHLNDRQNWAIFYLNFNWNNVIWSDETYISIQSNKNSKLWIHKNDTVIKRSVKYPLKIHVWGCILKNNKLIIHIVDATMTGEKYVETLKLKLLPLIKSHYEKHNEKIIYQQDNAPAHICTTSNKFFVENNIEVMFWPANSPDLNPIENIWNLLKKKVGRITVKTKQELIDIIIEVSNEFNIDTINKVIDSMDNRIDALFNNSFDSINY